MPIFDRSSDSRTTQLQTPLALRPREAARALSISERTLWQLTHDGLVPHVKLGTGKKRSTLYPVEALQAWLNQQVSQPKGGSDDAA